MSITRIDKLKDVGIDLQIEIPPSVPSSFRRIRKIEIFPVTPSTEDGGADLGSLLFNNSNQFLQFPREGVINLTDGASPFTIEAWIKPTSIKTIALVDANGNPDPLAYGDVIIGDTAAGGNNWSLQLFNNKISFYRYNSSLGGPRFFTSNSEIPLNQWTHVAVSYDGISTLSIFIDGVLDASFADYSPPEIQYSVITIGNLFDTGSSVSGGGAYAYEGYITNLRINDDEYFYEMVNPFLSTAPLGNIAGTTLRLLADQNNPTKDSGPNNVTITNVGSVTSSSEYPTIYDCANNDAKVLMVGWAVGPRALTRSSNLLYAYGDETVERANTNSAWVYKNSGSTISTATSVTEYPWQAEWNSGVTATKICASISSFVYDSSSALVDYIFGDIPASWQFENTSITQLSLGNSVTSIGSEAFRYCSGFTGSLTIPNTVTSIGSYAFYQCSNFTGSLTIPNSVTSIGSFAFRSAGFTGSLTLGSGLTSIADYAFNQTSFTGSLTIPNSVTSLGPYAFDSSGFTGSLTLGSGLTSINNHAFSNCNFTGLLTIPNSVTSIESSAFNGCSGFTGSLTIPNSVTSIGSYAFSDCTGFTGLLTIPNNITSIASDVFNGCSGFTGSLTIPDSVTSIGIGAFIECSGFTGSLTIPNSVTSIGSEAFRYCSGFTGSLTLGSSVTTIGSKAFYYCNFTGSLTIPNSVTSIGSYAFEYCTGFTGSLTIPNSVTSIGSEAFRYCTGFTGSLTISGTTSISSYAFNNCSFNGLNVTGTSINDSQFENANYVGGSLNIANTVTTIGSHAFFYCTGFTGSLTIGNSVESINTEAFRGCSGFTGSLTIGSFVTSIAPQAFAVCSFTGSLTIPNSVTSIGSYAFSDCYGFNSLTIPNSATTISSGAFYNNSSLTNAYLNQSFSLLPVNTFGADSGLTTIHLRPSPNTPAGWTIGAGQTVGGKSGVTVVADWTTYPNPP